MSRPPERPGEPLRPNQPDRPDRRPRCAAAAPALSRRPGLGGLRDSAHALVRHRQLVGIWLLGDLDHHGRHRCQRGRAQPRQRLAARQRGPRAPRVRLAAGAAHRLAGRRLPRRGHHRLQPAGTAEHGHPGRAAMEDRRLLRSAVPLLLSERRLHRPVLHRLRRGDLAHLCRRSRRRRCRRAGGGGTDVRAAPAGAAAGADAGAAAGRLDARAACRGARRATGADPGRHHHAVAVRACRLQRIQGHRRAAAR